jgi:hypothetical protein
MAYTDDITLTLEVDSLYKITGPAGLNAYYSGNKVLGTGSNPYFFANGTSELKIESDTQITSGVSIIKILPSYYDTYDSQGGTWVYQPSLDKWTSKYSFRPEWMCLVGNRLVTFKNGYPYVHDSSSYNTFYDQSFDSAIGFVHNEGGNSIKLYNDISIEGDTPDIAHVRTEVPHVQSSDIRGGTLNEQTTLAGEFSVREGVNYAPILRDRLSPNSSGTYDQKLYKGDPVRGEIGKFQVLFSKPTNLKSWKFVNIVFTPSRGHKTTNGQ